MRWLLALALVACPVVARGDEPKSDKLIDEGKALEANGKLEAACAKYHEALAASPHFIGALMLAARCEEQLGATASALRHFREALAVAQSTGLPQHQKAADQAIKELEPQVAHLRMTFAETLPGTRVAVDDRTLTVDDVADLEVDPGERTIIVTAPNRLPYETKVTIAKSGKQALAVPALASQKNTKRTVGMITGISGVVAFGTGLGLWVHARHLYNSQFHFNPADPNNFGCSTQTGYCQPFELGETQRASTEANFGTALVYMGAAATVAGGYLLLTSSPKSGSERAVSVLPAIAPDQIGVVAAGRF
jgi:tetratricopeptide (TPR) repeat protein